MFRVRPPIVVISHPVRVGARPAPAVVGSVSDTQVLLPATAAAVGGIFGAVLWGLRGGIFGAVGLGLVGMLVASSTPLGDTTRGRP